MLLGPPTDHVFQGPEDGLPELSIQTMEFDEFHSEFGAPRIQSHPEFYWDIPYFQNTLVAKAQLVRPASEARKAGRLRADWVSTVYVSPSESVKS